MWWECRKCRWSGSRPDIRSEHTLPREGIGSSAASRLGRRLGRYQPVLWAVAGLEAIVKWMLKILGWSAAVAMIIGAMVVVVVLGGKL
jgi:hypothetical protein